MATQHSRSMHKDTRMKRRPSAKAIPRPIATTNPPSAATNTVSPPKTASSTRSGLALVNHHPLHHRASLPSMAQFTFAPTSTRTVVTTTTTTTTTFPPLVFPPPRLPEDLDPRVHPLANAETPPSLRNFVFSIDGRPTYFHESDDPQRSLYEVTSPKLPLHTILTSF
jgi:hypothetical protein